MDSWGTNYSAYFQRSQRVDTENKERIVKNTRIPYSESTDEAKVYVKNAGVRFLSTREYKSNWKESVNIVQITMRCFDDGNKDRRNYLHQHKNEQHN